MLILCAAWTLGSFFILFFCTVSIGPSWYRYLRLWQGGALVEGRVIQRQQGEPWLFFIYEFEARLPGEAASLFTGQQVVHDDQPRLIEAGESVNVRYLPNDPDLSALEPYFGPPGKAPLVIVVIGTVFALGGLAMLPRRWRVWAERRRLFTDGRLVSAKIVNRWRTVDEQDRSLYCLAYEFEATLPDGRSRLITAAENNRLAYESLRLGQMVTVRYLPEQPERCRLEVSQKSDLAV